MRYGLAYNGFYPIGELLEIARAADGTAIEGIWLAEHLGYRDAFVPAAAILSATRNLKVAPTAVSPYARNAMLTAMQTASLCELDHGRVILGLGTGNPMAYAESGMAQERPVSAIREYLHLIRALWSGERVTWGGRMLQMCGATFHVPLSPVPPIQLAAMRDRMLALAGEATDGVVISAGLAPEAIRISLEKSFSAAKEVGRPPSAVEAVGFVITAVSQSGGEAMEEARRNLAYLFRNRFAAEQLQVTGARLDAEALANASSRRDWDAATRLVSNEVVELCSIAGTLEECRAMTARYAETGLDVLVLVPLGGAKGGHLALEMIRGLS